jgi:hypothetical protein
MFFQLNTTEQNMPLHFHGNAVNIYIADSNTGRSTIQRVHNAEFPMVTMLKPTML